MQTVHDAEDALVERIGLVVARLVLEYGHHAAALELLGRFDSVGLVVDHESEVFCGSSEEVFEHLLVDFVHAGRL